MHDRVAAALNRTKATDLNESWGVGAIQVRYSYDGHWYATLSRFPAALFDPHGYLYFASEDEYRAAPISIGKQISVPKPGISGLPGYICVTGPVVPDAGEASAAEGRELLRMHRTRERSRGLVTRKKRSVLFESGRLACEACGFDFAVVYGPLGEGFAECHHTLPLGQNTGERSTRLSDLAVVCANCHRMLHQRPWHTVAGLTVLLRSRLDGQS